MKEIKEILRFALCAQPVPKALSVISFISAGLEILCAACAGGTFCDFRDFCVPYILCAQPVPEALSLISFISAGLKNLCAITPAT